MSKYRLHLNPTVRPHARDVWTVSIGKAINADKSKLVPKSFYWGGTENDANAEAKSLAAKWAFLVKNWDKLYQPSLSAAKRPFADEPHWQPAVDLKPTISDADVAEFQSIAPTTDDIAETYADINLESLLGLYSISLNAEVENGEIQSATKWTTEKNVGNALTYFGKATRLDAVNSNTVVDAKSKMLQVLARRTSENYLSAFKKMLLWFYDSEYGKGWDKIANFDKSFRVVDATNTAVEIPTIAQLKTIYSAANDRQRLFIMLALNCGMYQADIGRLTLDEINLEKGYVFWDREKEPSNPFKVRHDFWPQTKALVKQFIQGKSDARYFDDYRIGAAPVKLDCSKLAFVDTLGNPMYRVRENGMSYDKITETIKPLNEKFKTAGAETFQFKNLRKAANQILKDILNEVADDSKDSIVGIEEISDMFLGQGSGATELKRLYSTKGVNGFGRLNNWLAKVGQKLESEGVFKG